MLNSLDPSHRKKGKKNFAIIFDIDVAAAMVQRRLLF